MNALERQLRDRVAAGEKLLAPFVTAGYPDLPTTAAILRAIDGLGLGCIEIGIPFSDPVADGATIQASFTAALDAGLTVGEVFEQMGTLAGELVTPRIAMVSYSIGHAWGPKRFLSAAAEAGFAGVLFPDLPMGAEPRVADLAGELGLANVMLVAPTTTPDRARRIAQASSGFIYYMSVAGITGERRELPPELSANVASLKAASDGKPVFVGFGIGRPEQVAQVTAVADGAIVGSALIRHITGCIDAGKDAQATADTVLAYVEDLCTGLSGARRDGSRDGR